jgi:signal transduction histidine kinase
VTESSGALSFEISDDGVGFDPDSVELSHGFVNMKDRIGAHGGVVTIESQLGMGTTVRGELPLTPLPA